MAVCNGEKYIKQQIDSILIQLEQSDELIVSYDKSEDNTYQIIEEFCNNRKHKKILPGKIKYIFEN